MKQLSKSSGLIVLTPVNRAATDEAVHWLSADRNL
jgi:hypothetical protein